MKNILLLMLLICIFSCTDQLSGTDPNPVIKENVIGAKSNNVQTLASSSAATNFNTLFTRKNVLEWTGSDIAYSIPLPGGKNLWTMGDTFLGPVYDPALPAHPTRWRDPQGMLMNTMMVTNGSGTTPPTYNTTLYNWVGPYPVPFFPETSEGYRRWCKHGIYRSTTGKVYVMLFVNYQGPGGGLDIQLVRTDVAVVNPTTWAVESIVTGSTSNTVIYGSSVMLDGNYVYIYGCETSSPKYMHVARVGKDNITGPWEYYKGGSTWDSNPAGSYRILENVSTEYTDFKSGTSYYLITQEDTPWPSTNVYRYKATSPRGPFNNPLLIFNTPSHGPTTWTYDAKAHPQFKRNGTSTDLLISYDVNSDNINNVFANADLYRPYFYWISGWQ